jgi:hypothetical protein
MFAALIEQLITKVLTKVFLFILLIKPTAPIMYRKKSVIKVVISQARGKK